MHYEYKRLDDEYGALPAAEEAFIPVIMEPREMKQAKACASPIQIGRQLQESECVYPLGNKSQVLCHVWQITKYFGFSSFGIHWACASGLCSELRTPYLVFGLRSDSESECGA